MNIYYLGKSQSSGGIGNESALISGQSRGTTPYTRKIFHLATAEGAHSCLAILSIRLKGEQSCKLSLGMLSSRCLGGKIHMRK
uniref:Uncharacterized protein n=1 Tax=Picea glauca TaxID=3330 RepID=A0A117NIH9_PICGL|nr:hypothetical protein ABT39_MTgene3213 [Picea glauca]